MSVLFSKKRVQEMIYARDPYSFKGFRYELSNFYEA